MSSWLRKGDSDVRMKSFSNSRSRSCMTERRRACGVCWNFCEIVSP